MITKRILLLLTVIISLSIFTNSIYATEVVICNCSAEYMGYYTVNTESTSLNLRSGHGTGFSIITSVPKGATVYVSKADGMWAHVEYNGYTGYCAMNYLTTTTSSNIYLSDSNISLIQGQEGYTLTLLNATDNNITWISKDTNIATVDNGTIIPISLGETIIYAIYNKKYYQCDVVVKKNMESSILGDCNNNKTISSIDILLLKKYIFNIIDNISNADINLDNKINIIDLIQLKQKVLINGSNKNEYLGKYYLTSSLNIRKNAGTEYTSYGIVDKYTLINVIETVRTTDGTLWGKYEYNGNLGWSSLKYAKKLGITGTTSNGFDIYQADGITYINDLLIVNKTYSLPNTYVPSNNALTTLTDNAFISMQKEASKFGLNLYVSSGYRSYEYQKSLYQRYVNKDGQEKADTYSARAGHSEHQTGLCFDLNTIEDSFANTPEGKWVAQNCYKYGFIIRYPKEKQSITGYKYEPWHLRYVGIDLATKLYEKNLTLEEYLGITSQYE